MRKMMLYGKKYGGVDPQLIEGDSFRMIISVPEFGENPAKTVKIIPTEQVTEQVRDDVRDDVTGDVTGEVLAFLKVLLTGPLGRTAVQGLLGLKGQANFRQRYLEPALSSGLVEMTQPDSPKSPTQKYRLTAKGQKWLKENRE